MVDVLSQQQQQDAVGFDSTEKMETDKVELSKGKEELDDGELPEEGEITEDEEETVPIHDSHNSSTRSRGHTSSTHHHRSHHSPSRSSRSRPAPRISPPKASRTAPKYKDPNAVKPASGEEVMMESWINGVQKKKRTSPVYDSNEEYYGGSKTEDKQNEDERAIQPEAVDEYGDVDYRQQHIEGIDTQKRPRRRSDSPIDSFGTMAKRPRGDFQEEEVQYPPPKRGPVRNKWTEKTICKFFREGYCRDSENCAYSHNAADSHRRSELCRFYNQGYCKRGLACPNLHGEYPCKAFNKGECSKEQCNFSHQPLNDYTRPIFEQMLRDDELAMKLLSKAGIRPQRRVLLPDGPEEWDKFFIEDATSENRSVPTSNISNGAQSKNTNPTTSISTTSSYGFFNAVPSHSSSRVPSAHPNNSPHQQAPSSSSILPSKKASPPQPEPISIDDMFNFGRPSTEKSFDQPGLLSQSSIQNSLQSLHSMFETKIVDESPRSPPMSGIVVSDSAPVIPTTRSYIAYPLSIPDTSGSLDLNLIQQLTSGIYKNNDPRLKRLAEKQFDLVSKTFEQQRGTQVILNQQQKQSETTSQTNRQPAAPHFHPPSVSSSVPKPVDPRARDPRTIRPAAPPDLMPPTSFPSIQLESDDFQSKVAQQLQMVEMAKQANKTQADEYDIRTASSHYEPSSQRDPSSSYYERWHDSQPYRGHPRSGRAGRGRFRYGEDRGKRHYQHEEQSWNENSTENQKASPPSRPPVESAVPREDQTNPAAQPMSLREKRKHNQFESPLSSSRRF